MQDLLFSASDDDEKQVDPRVHYGHSQERIFPGYLDFFFFIDVPIPIALLEVNIEA